MGDGVVSLFLNLFPVDGVLFICLSGASGYFSFDDSFLSLLVLLSLFWNDYKVNC
jgi:hypothetical protein